MPSVLTLTAFLLREEGEGGELIKKFNLQTGGLLSREGGLLEKGGSLELLRYFSISQTMINTMD